MLNFVRITMPTPMAIKLAEATDPRTCADQGYIVKSALAEAFVDGAVRPWRIISFDGDLIDIVGFAGLANVSNNEKSRKLGITVEKFTLDLKQGDTLQIDVQAAAVRAIRLGADRKQRMYIDAGATHVEGSYKDFVPTPRHKRGEVWNAWLIERLGVDCGVLVIDIPEPAKAMEMNLIRKRGGYPAPIIVPVLESRLTVRVVDPVAFRSAVAHGISKFKDVGLGSIIPTEVLEDAA